MNFLFAISVHFESKEIPFMTDRLKSPSVISPITFLLSSTTYTKPSPFRSIFFIAFLILDSDLVIYF